MSSATAAMAAAPAAPASPAAPAGAAPGTPAVQTGAAGAPGAAPAAPANEEFAYARDWAPEIRDGVVKAAFKDPQSIAVGYLAAQKLIGVPPDQIIRMPKADDATGRREALSKFGIPAKVEDYKINAPQGADDSLKAMVGTAAAELHRIGIPQPEAQKLVDWWTDYGNKTVAEEAKQWGATVTKESAELNVEWGERGNANRAAIKEAQKMLGWDDATIDAMAKAVGLKKTFGALAKIGTPMLPAEFKGGEAGAGKGGFNAFTPAEATAKRSQLMNDEGFAKRWYSGDAEARREMAALDSIIADGKAQQMAAFNVS